MTLIGHIADNNGNPLVGYIGGIKGITGRGIASIVENNDYTLTIYLTDGTSYTTDPIAGFTDVAFDENYDLVVTKTDGTTITVETDLGSYEDLLKGYKDDAETAATNAGNSETAASGYASNALSSENNASTYANNASGSATAASGSADSASASASSASTQALKSEGFALGEQNGNAVTSGSPYYHNNSKYFSQLSSASSTNASAYATNANTDALKAEGYAVGKQNGTSVSSDSPYYHHNAMYYNSQATNMASLATNKANSAGADALKAEGFSVGEQNGTPVTSDSDYYENNAKYYADSAEDSKDAVIGGIDSLLPTVSLPKADILSFTDGQAVIPAKSLVADIDPIQDLHGYDAPWVGGAGKNKMPQQTDTKIACRFSEGETLTVSCDTATNGASVVFNYYRSDQTRIDYWTANQSIAGGRIGKTFTLTEDVYYIAFTNSTASRKQIEIASSATSYEPYENICPISGHDEVVVSVVGKNLVDKTNFTQTNSFVWGYRNVGYKLKGGVTYTFSTSFTFDSIRLVSVDEQTVYEQVNASNKITYTPTNDTNVVFRLWHGSSFDFTDITVQLELGATATAYEPYTGQSYNTPLGQTVYGGTLDVVSGVLTVDRAMMDLGTQSWTYQSTWASWYTDYIADVKGTNTGAEIPNFISDRFEAVPTNEGMSPQAQGYTGISSTTRGSSGCRILVKNGSTTEAPTGQLCYELATPQTYQLTPQQVELLLGENNIFADSGKVSIVYNADVQKYIDNAVGTKEEDMVANNAITSGSLFSVNDRLYKATSTIAVGETIIVGVNCTETSIIEQLNALITLL